MDQYLSEPDGDQKCEVTDLGAVIAKGQNRFAVGDGKCDTDIGPVRGRSRRERCQICFPLRLAPVATTERHSRDCRV